MFSQRAQLIRVVPVHPIAQSLRLFRLSSREAEDSAFALVHEFVDAEFVDGVLCSESQLLLDFDFNPQPLAIEAVLVSLVMASHCEEALIRIFVRSPPRMMHAHWIIGRDGTVQKTPPLLTAILFPQLAECVVLSPEVEDEVFARNEVAVGNGLEHWSITVRAAVQAAW